MSNDAKRADLIGSLILWLIDHPKRFFLQSTPFPRRVNWLAKVDINDIGKVIGKMSAHRDSLRCLIGLMGARYGEQWVFEAMDPEDGPRIDKPKIPFTPDYNPSPAQDFLGQILDAILNEPAAIEVTRGPNAHDFKFVLRSKSMSDYKILVTTVAAGREPLAPVAALGTLFRAYGRQKGVNFTIEVPSQ